MVCVDPTGTQVGSHAKITDIPPRGCEHRHKCRQLIPQVRLPGVTECFAFYGCQNNELSALTQRHLIAIPPTTAAMMAQFRRMLAVLLADTPPRPLQPIGQEQVIDRLSGPKKRAMQEAFAEYNLRGWMHHYTKVRMFVKFEKAGVDPADPPELKAPRAIQYRSTLYTGELARYLRPIEDWVFHARGTRASLRSFTSKGLDSWQTARRLKVMERWPDTVFILLDHSRFDSTLRWELRKYVEHEYSKRFYQGDRWLEWLLEQQLENSCSSAGGIKYKVKGTMLSGEYNTSCGDTIELRRNPLFRRTNC